MKKQPQKPTQSYGFLSFSKPGKVKKEVFKLSGDKRVQESEVVSAFIRSLKGENRYLTNQVLLPENDNDCEAYEWKTKIVIEIVELLFTDFIDAVFPSIQGGESFSRNEKIGWVREGKPYYIVSDGRYIEALIRKIKEKIEKHYSKDSTSKFWLLVYSTFPYETEYWLKGQRESSEGLNLARRYLVSEKMNPFDEVWFFNLLTNPVQVWARE